MLSQWENVGAVRFDDIEAVVVRLREVAKTKKPGEWILAYEVDPSLQKDGDKLTAAVLYPASRDNPILVLNASLHFGYCNSKTLALAGITRELKDAPGALYGRNADGTPNGVLEGGGALLRAFRVVDAVAETDLVEAGLAVCAEANKSGITTFCDQGTGLFGGKADLDTYRAIAATGRMTVRLRYTARRRAGCNLGRHGRRVRQRRFHGAHDRLEDHLRRLQPRPHRLSARTLSWHARCRFLYVDAAALKEKVEKRLRQGWQVVIHGNGDKAIDNILDAYEQAKSRGAPMDKRPCIEHCSILHDDQIGRMKTLGISPSFLIGHVYYWGKLSGTKSSGPKKRCFWTGWGRAKRSGSRGPSTRTPR